MTKALTLAEPVPAMGRQGPVDAVTPCGMCQDTGWLPTANGLRQCECDHTARLVERATRDRLPPDAALPR